MRLQFYQVKKSDDQVPSTYVLHPAIRVKAKGEVKVKIIVQFKVIAQAMVKEIIQF